MGVLHFFLNNGIGQNITAGALTVILGFLWSRTKFWPLHTLKQLHESHKALHASHAELHAKLDALQASNDQLHNGQKTLRQALAGVSGPRTSNPGG